jgi:opacity protein-like surface antigen
MCIVIVSAAMAQAQDNAPKAEIFGGYSHVGADFSQLGLGTRGLNGWDASLAGNFNRYLGVVADFSGTYGTPFSGIDVKNYTFMFGPKLSYRTRRVTPFGQALFGGDRISADVPALSGLLGTLIGRSFSRSDTSFALALGGGVDVGLTDAFAVRAIQADYLRTNFFNTNQSSYRIAVGLVLRLGGQ